MAKIWITELSSLGNSPSNYNAQPPVAQFPATVNQTPLTLGATQQSAAFNAATRLLRIVADGDCHFVVGSNPTATVNDSPLSGNKVPEYIGVKPGDKLAVIAA